MGSRSWAPAQMLARLYDWEHDDFTVDIDLYLELARRTGGPVLELACGSGRVLAPLVAAGLEVVGVDRSEAMLERARARIGGGTSRTRLIQADLEVNLDSRLADEPFAMIIFALDALGLVSSSLAQLKLLRGMERRLTDHGLIVIDVVHAAPLFDEVQGLPVLQQTGEDSTSGATVVKWMVRRIHPATQELELLSLYDLTWQDGEMRRLTEPLDLRYFSRFELEHLLTRAGLEMEAIYGDYELGELEDESPRMIVLARSGRAHSGGNEQ